MNEHVAAPLNVAKIRQDFPILELKPYGKTLVYLDNAASAQKPRQVVDRMVQATYNEYANVHRGLHYLANAATEAYEAARESVRAFLNAGSMDEMISTKSATEAINLVASSFGQRFSTRATRSSSRSWNTTPISCPGIFCVSAKARC